MKRFFTIFGLSLALVSLAFTGTAQAQNKQRGKSSAGETRSGKGGEQKITLSSFDLEGQMRTPQLLYFLDRAGEELKRAALERRSFIPAMVRSIDEEAL